MRRPVVALVAVLVAGTIVLSLAGCSSGSSDTSSSTDTNAAPAASTAAAQTLPAIDDRSANASDTFVPFPTGADVPAVLNQKITVDKQPTLIYFYDSSQQTSQEVRSIIDDVRYSNRGLVDLVAYDIGKYLTANADGSVDVDSGLAKDSADSLAVTFARNPAIDVSYTPFIVLTDDQGYIIFEHAGLIDATWLEREVQRAAE